MTRILKYEPFSFAVKNYRECVKVQIYIWPFICFMAYDFIRYIETETVEAL